MINAKDCTFLYADWLLTCDEKKFFIKDGAVIFNKNIVDVGTLAELKKKYPEYEYKYCGKNSILMPGLVNSHIHLEFSANKTQLKYGNFMDWLNSVVQKREDLIEKATEKVIDEELNKMLQSGTTTIGAISSHNFDMTSCIKTPINVVYFNEAIGSKADMVDTLFTDFKAKLKNANEHKKDNFIPAIAIHSPYSVHPFLIREVLQIAKEKHLAVSAHFQESKGENEWLNYSKGEFTLFFKNFLNQNKSLTKPLDFLNQFKDIKNLSFTHCVEANKDELETIKNLDASIIHCPNSNRLLSNTILNLEHLENTNLALGTDGLSSNNSLNLFDEIRNAFFMHTEIHPNILAKKLLLSATKGGAKALGLNKGILKKDKDADIISFTLPDTCENEDDLLTAIILHTTKVNQTYIQGKQIEPS